jgi:uncharacterized protein (DUF697 family)
MTDDQRAGCHAIIHTASASAAGIGAGLAQLPCSDAVALIPIQIAMVVSLGAVFGVHIVEGTAKGVVLSSAAAFGGRAISQVLVGWIPFLGNAINASTAAGLTEAIGWAVADKFDRGEIPAD